MRIRVVRHPESGSRLDRTRARRAASPVFAVGGLALGSLVVLALLTLGRSTARAQTAGGGNAQNGKTLFNDKGCSGCHGPDARGMSPVESPTGGPRIAPPPLALPAFTAFVRNPTGKMIPFGPQDITDAQLADVYAYLQSLAPGGGNGGGGNAGGQGGRQVPAGNAGAPIDSMSDLMVSMVYPATNNILLSVYRGGPQADTDWAVVQRNAVLLAESGNVLLNRAPAGANQADWARDAKALVDAGAAVYKAARAKDTASLLTTDQAINASCVTCHKQFRFNNDAAPIAAPPHP